MRIVRSIGRLRLLAALAVVVITVYIVGQLRTPDALDTDHRVQGSSHGRQRSHINRDIADSPPHSRSFKANNYQYDDSDLVYYKKDIPLIWVGGVPRSGTTLMRVMLDAHQDIRCGEETRVIPRLLSMHVGMAKSAKEMSRLREAKITEEVLDHALAAYILSIIAEHGETAPRLCNKDPFTLKSMNKILDMFPNSKFLFMIRDGRATVHSIISRHVTIKGFDINSYRGGLQDWNRAIDTMYKECMKVGQDVCLPVYYEQLVLHPRTQMERILNFLNVDWDEMVVHHEQSINKSGGVSLSGKELSTDQVSRPINTEALTSWVQHIPPDVRRDMAELAPMLARLGYDPDAYPPNYGEPDTDVQAHDDKLKSWNKFYLDRRPKNVPAAAAAPPPNPDRKPLRQLQARAQPNIANQFRDAQMPWDHQPAF